MSERSAPWTVDEYLEHFRSLDHPDLPRLAAEEVAKVRGYDLSAVGEWVLQDKLARVTGMLAVLLEQEGTTP